MNIKQITDSLAKLYQEENKWIVFWYDTEGEFEEVLPALDLAGVSIAYKAYINSLAGGPAPVMDGYTGEQRFFIGFSQAFLSKSREERARQMIKTDVHSPATFRVNGTLSNIDGFYEAFDIGPQDAMYRAPKNRVSIW